MMAGEQKGSRACIDGITNTCISGADSLGCCQMKASADDKGGCIEVASG